MRLGTPHLFSASLLLSAVLIGCAPKEDDTFGSGGVDNNTTDLPCDDCDSGDTGTTATTGTTDTATETETTDDGWPDPEDDGGPSQRDPDCYMEEIPNNGWNIFCYVDVRDKEGNLNGGKMNLVISGGQFGDGVSPPEDKTGISTLETDGACIFCLEGDETEGATLYFALQIPDSSDNYDLVWTIKDKGGNESNELEARVDN